MGWVGADSAEFVVAIRSALVSPAGDEVMLYAGVGVVAAADSAVRPGIDTLARYRHIHILFLIHSVSMPTVSPIYGPVSS